MEHGEYMKIKVVGFDPSISNWGVCKATVDLSSGSFTVDDLILIETESESKQMKVRKESDNLKRAAIIYPRVVELCEGARFAIAEIPFALPNQATSSVFNAGVVTGLLAACPVPLIQVFPREVKELAVGDRSATKEQMIAWASSRYPDASWLYRKLKGKMVLTAANEHLADAVAVINAGIQSEQFQQARALAQVLTA